MFRMLTCFDLKPGVDIADFRNALNVFTTHMMNIDLLKSADPVGQRQRHPVMDTDSERDHEYFFILNFENREQCDQAVDYIDGPAQSADDLHVAAYSAIENPVFICWEDLPD